MKIGEGVVAFLCRGRQVVSWALLVLCLGLFVGAMSQEEGESLRHMRTVIVLPFQQAVTFQEVANPGGKCSMALSFKNIGYGELQRALSTGGTRLDKSGTLLSNVAVGPDGDHETNARLTLTFSRDDVAVKVNRFSHPHLIVIDVQPSIAYPFNNNHILYSAASLLHS